MSLFGKLFANKAPAGRDAGAPGAVDFLKALSLHLGGAAEPALAAYLEIAAAHPDDAVAPFFAAALEAGRGETAAAAGRLHQLSRLAATAGESLAHAVSLQLNAQLGGQQLANPIGLPAVAVILVAFGEQLKREGLLQEAAVCFEIAAGLTPDNANVLHKLGDTLHDLRNYGYAEPVLLEALRLAPNHWGALYSYAVLLQDLGRNDEALSLYGKAVRLNPHHANCQNNYGAALLRANRLEEALAHCTLAAGLDPASPFVRINLGNIHLLQQEYAAAGRFFAEAIALDGNLAAAYFGLASVEQSLQGDPVRVRELYLKAIEINPAIPEIHQALGDHLAACGDPQALTCYRSAAQLNPDLGNLRKALGNACLQQGLREEALEHLKAALRQDPDDTALRDTLAAWETKKPE